MPGRLMRWLRKWRSVAGRCRLGRSRAVADQCLVDRAAAPGPAGRRRQPRHRPAVRPRPRPTIAPARPAGSASSRRQSISRTPCPRSTRRSALGADAVEIQVQPTSDGQMVLFHDATLDCRTDGHGPVREHSARPAEGGSTSAMAIPPTAAAPFRCAAAGSAACRRSRRCCARCRRARIVFAFKSRDPADADALVAAFRRAGVAIDDKYGFFGDPAVISADAATGARRLDLRPEASRRLLSTIMLRSAGRASSRRAAATRTVVVPLNDRWMIWGWPYRFFDRMAKANTRVADLRRLPGRQRFRPRPARAI